MATQEDSETLDDVENLYTLLNVDRTANPKDIRAAYLRLASHLHPDKASNAAIRALSNQEQNGPVLDMASRMASLRRVRQRADEQFVRVDRAYRILADPVKKLIYDEYGLEALRTFEVSEMAKSTLAAHIKHPTQVRHLMDELIMESSQRRLEATLGMSGRIAAECSCTPFIGADGKLILKNLFPEVNQLVVQQSVEVPISDASRVTFGGYALHRSGMGMGSTFLAVQRNISPGKWVSSQMEFGYKPKMSASFGQTINRGGASVQIQMSHQESGLGFKVNTSSQLDPKTMVNASFGVGAEDGTTLHVARFVRKGLGRIRGEVRLSGSDVGMRLSYQHFIKSVARSIQMSCKLGNRGMEVEVGARRLLLRQVKINTAVRVGLQGVTAVLRLQRGGMQFQLPVLLSSVHTAWTLLVGGLIPAAVDAGVGWLLSCAWKRRAVRLRVSREISLHRHVRKAWKDAANQTALMRHVAERSAAREAENGGLVILLARYGCQLHRDCGSNWWTFGSEPIDEGRDDGADNAASSRIEQLISAPNVDVTIALQFFVKESILMLPTSGKSSLLGFYTPAPCHAAKMGGTFESWLLFGGASWEDGARRADGFYHEHGHGRGGGANGLSTIPQLYIRYRFAGRLYEETFDDDFEVELPSPTSAQIGGDNTR